MFEVKGNVAKFFLDVTDDFSFGGGDERITTFSKDLHEVVGKIATSKIKRHHFFSKSSFFSRQKPLKTVQNTL